MLHGLILAVTVALAQVPTETTTTTTKYAYPPQATVVAPPPPLVYGNVYTTPVYGVYGAPVVFGATTTVYGATTVLAPPTAPFYGVPLYGVPAYRGGLFGRRYYIR